MSKKSSHGKNSWLRIQYSVRCICVEVSLCFLCTVDFTDFSFADFSRTERDSVLHCQLYTTKLDYAPTTPERPPSRVCQSTGEPRTSRVFAVQRGIEKRQRTSEVLRRRSSKKTKIWVFSSLIWILCTFRFRNLENPSHFIFLAPKMQSKMFKLKTIF